MHFLFGINYVVKLLIQEDDIPHAVPLHYVCANLF